ncbi:hypothetical protein GGF32_003820 [Allomyces javanicus]|nr:hypothetical protein GGF32_003820 [Allomyces javanicus]
MTTYEPMLEDAPISGQRYAVLNIVNPHTAQKADQTYVKVKYVCGSLDEAKQYAKRARDNEKYLDVFVAEVGKFLPVSIDPTDIAEQEYSNAVLTELMREHRLERDRADQLFEEYVQENLERNAQQVRDKAVAKDTVTAESV